MLSINETFDLIQAAPPAGHHADAPTDESWQFESSANEADWSVPLNADDSGADFAELGVADNALFFRVRYREGDWSPWSNVVQCAQPPNLNYTGGVYDNLSWGTVYGGEANWRIEDSDDGENFAQVGDLVVAENHGIENFVAVYAPRQFVRVRSVSTGNVPLGTPSNVVDITL